MRARARARLIGIFSSSARAWLVYYLLINILNKNNINNRFFMLASSISEARARVVYSISLFLGSRSAYKQVKIKDISCTARGCVGS
ncbi:hypothetical protein Hanom_Chr17g01535351 [Helianthus anomalus]